MLRLSRPLYLIGAVLTIFLIHFFFSSTSSTSYKPPLPHADPSLEHSNPRYVNSNGPHPKVGGPSGSLGIGKGHGIGQSRHSSSTSSRGTESDGVLVDEGGHMAFVPGMDEKHPIEVLMERARKKAQVIEAQINEVQTLDDAVEEYERVFKLRPPAGFAKWWRFTKSFKPATVGVAPLLSAAHNMMLPFLSHPASILRDRVVKAIDTKAPGVFVFTLVPDGTGDMGLACTKDQKWTPKEAETRGRGRVQVRGTMKGSWRCNNTLQLILPILPTLPDEMFEQDPPFMIAFNTDDGPHGMVHSNFRDRSINLARAGRVWPEAQLKAAEQNMRWTYGWHWACPEGAPLKSDATDLVLNDLNNNLVLEDSASQGQKTFIADYARAIDYCYNPNLMELHSATILDHTVAAGELEPFITNCRTTWNTDIAGVPLDGAWEVAKYIPWEEKRYQKAFWRGSATGAFHAKHIAWRKSQRERLHFFAHNTSDTDTSILVDRQREGGKLSIESYPVKKLIEKYLDVGISGKPVQCSEEDGSCEDLRREIKFMEIVSKEDALNFKYVFDVDGNGWSSRFRRLLAGNNVVLKSTLFPEWFSDLLIPWYHFVPVKLDYSDVFDIMAFFTGSPDGSTSGRDDLGREIAKNALNFIETRFREADMQAFMYLLILEWWRVMSDDRESATYQS